MTTKDGKIHINNWVGILGLLITVLSSVGYLVYKAGSIVSNIDTMIPLVKRIPIIESKTEELWRRSFTTSHSPTVLNEESKKVDTKSFTDQYYTEFLQKVRDKHPQNLYQAQEFLIVTMLQYKEDPRCEIQLEDLAYKNGIDVGTVLYIAATAIRANIIQDLGLKDVDERIIK